MTKFSAQPGPRASNVEPCAHGDKYSYTVDKFWVVRSTSDGQVRLITRKGKERVVRSDDLNLHRANWWERLLYRRRFQAIAPVVGAQAASSVSRAPQASA